MRRPASASRKLRPAMNTDKDPPRGLLAHYRTMARIRAFENAAEIASQGGVQAWGMSTAAKPALVRGPLHLSTGQEAVAAGVCANLHARGSADLARIAATATRWPKGADVNRMMCRAVRARDGYQQAARAARCTSPIFGVGMLGAQRRRRGRHADRRRRRACAARFAAQGEIVACFFGDGAVNRGPFHRSAELGGRSITCRVLFVCEDNRISATTPTGPMTGGAGASCARRGDRRGRRRRSTATMSWPSTRAAARLVAEVRGGAGPRLLHAVTYRFKGHVSVDPGAYRDRTEVDAARSSSTRCSSRVEQLRRSWRATPIRSTSSTRSRRPKSTRGDGAGRSRALAGSQRRPTPTSRTTGAGQWR